MYRITPFSNVWQSFVNSNRQQNTQATKAKMYIYILGLLKKKVNWDLKYFEARFTVVHRPSLSRHSASGIPTGNHMAIAHRGGVQSNSWLDTLSTTVLKYQRQGFSVKPHCFQGFFFSLSLVPSNQWIPATSHHDLGYWLTSTRVIQKAPKLRGQPRNSPLFNSL